MDKPQLASQHPFDQGAGTENESDWMRNRIARLKPGQVRTLGTLLGLVLFVVLGNRRRIAFANLRADVQSNTQRMTDIIEAAVHHRPAQWYWLQKRWKSFYPELYPPS